MIKIMPDHLKPFKTILRVVLALLAMLTGGCLGMPEGVRPVDDFDLDRYLGTWYEIARLDHRFERGLNSVSAEYSLREDGGVKVVNRGYSSKTERWQEAVGKAYFVGRPNQGYLKVSFFGPFYGSYVIFGLDPEQYRYAFVTGPNRSYLWLLARTTTVSRELIDRFVTQAGRLGFDIGQLIFVDHLHTPPGQKP